MGGLLGLTIVLSYLMISTIRYRSFKDLDLRRRRPAWILPAIAIFFAVVAYRPEIALAALALAYVVSGPVGKFVGLFRRGEPSSPSASA
jgi:CDP-diacylglycerol--serine O-phosphatidyltransferase